MSKEKIAAKIESVTEAQALAEKEPAASCHDHDAHAGCHGHGDHGAANAPNPAAAGKYTCPMCPGVAEDEPVPCPMCGMALDPPLPVASARVEYTCPQHPKAPIKAIKGSDKAIKGSG